MKNISPLISWPRQKKRANRKTSDITQFK